jgi:uncharacterized alkaline shock family protein YloU
MKLKSTDKFVIFLYALGLTVVFALFLAIPLHYVPMSDIIAAVSGMYTAYRWYYFAGAVLLILLNIRIMASLFYSEEGKRLGVIKYTNEGEINISNDTIKALVLKTASEVRGLREIRVMIKPGKDNINILIKVQIMPDLNIPQTVKEVQEKVKSYLEAIAEIPVGEVRVTVENLASSTKLHLK